MFDLEMQHLPSCLWCCMVCKHLCAARIDFYKLHIFFVILFNFLIDRCYDLLRSSAFFCIYCIFFHLCLHILVTSVSFMDYFRSE